MLATLSLVDRHMPLQAGGRPYIGMATRQRVTIIGWIKGFLR